MATPTSSLAAEIESIKQMYAALNRNDVSGFLAFFDPQVEREEFPGTPMAGTVRGIDAMKEHVESARAKWAEGTCEPQRFTVAGDKVIVIAHVHVRLKNETEWREGDVFDVFVFRNGRAIQFNSYGTEREAMEYVGIREG